MELGGDAVVLAKLSLGVLVISLREEKTRPVQTPVEEPFAVLRVTCKLYQFRCSLDGLFEPTDLSRVDIAERQNTEKGVAIAEPPGHRDSRFAKGKPFVERSREHACQRHGGDQTRSQRIVTVREPIEGFLHSTKHGAVDCEAVA